MCRCLSPDPSGRLSMSPAPGRRQCCRDPDSSDSHAEDQKTAAEQNSRKKSLTIFQQTKDCEILRCGDWLRLNAKPLQYHNKTSEFEIVLQDRRLQGDVKVHGSMQPPLRRLQLQENHYKTTMKWQRLNDTNHDKTQLPNPNTSEFEQWFIVLTICAFFV